jgi:hypothetical protein
MSRNAYPNNPETRRRMNDAVKLALCDAVFGSIGVYAEQSTDASGVTTLRTEWQEGYNAAGGEIAERRVMLEQWFRTLPESLQATIGELLVRYELRPDYDSESKAVTLEANCSDLFMWGCSDWEEVTPEKLTEFHAACERGQSLLWICQQRQMRPQKPIVDDMKAAGTWTSEWESLPANPMDAHCGSGGVCELHGEQQK